MKLIGKEIEQGAFILPLALSLFFVLRSKQRQKKKPVCFPWFSALTKSGFESERAKVEWYEFGLLKRTLSERERTKNQQQNDGDARYTPRHRRLLHGLINGNYEHCFSTLSSLFYYAKQTVYYSAKSNGAFSWKWSFGVSALKRRKLINHFAIHSSAIMCVSWWKFMHVKMILARPTQIETFACELIDARLIAGERWACVASEKSTSPWQQAAGRRSAHLSPVLDSAVAATIKMFPGYSLFEW